MIWIAIAVVVAGYLIAKAIGKRNEENQQDYSEPARLPCTCPPEHTGQECYCIPCHWSEIDKEEKISRITKEIEKGLPKKTKN